MVLSIRRSLSRDPYAHPASRRAPDRVYQRKRSFLIKHSPKLAALLLLFYVLHHWHHRHHRHLASLPLLHSSPLTAPPHPPPPPLNLTLSPGVRKPGVSLVAACHNHHEPLRHTIRSWRLVHHLDEIILVDWASNPALRFLVEELPRFSQHDPALIVVRVEGEEKWEPARAFNLGFRAAHFARILRVECDHKVRRDFVAEHALRNGSMYAGNSRLVRAEGDEDLTGTLFIGKKDLLDVGGYDERIQDFGGEQEDLLERLQKNGMRRMDVDYNTLLHNHHEDEGERGFTSLQVEHLVEVAVNRELRHMVPPWNSLEAWRSFSFNGDSLSEMNTSIPSQMHANVQYRSILARRRVQSIRDMLSADDVESVKSRVLSKMLYERFDLPGDFSDLLEWSDKDRILFGLLDKMQKANSNVTPRVLVIQCVGGMVSRLYALASGLAAAYHTDRLPIIVWEKEPPLVTAFFHELFEVQDHFMVVDVDLQYFFDEYGEIEHDQAVERMMDVYDLVGLNEGDSHPIRTTNGRHIFIRAFAAIEAEIVRFTSPMSMREQIQLFEFDESVQSRLRHLVDQRLSERLGIYLPALPSNQSDITEGIVSRVKEKIQHTGFGALPSAYIIGDLDTLESLRPMLGSVIGESPLLMTCTAEETDCSRAEVSQLLALSKTKEFIATHEDKLWELVMLIRGQSTDW